MSPAPASPRWTAAVALAVGAAVFALHGALAPAAAPPADRGQPAVIAWAMLARLIPTGDVAAREQLAAAVLVAVAAAMVTHLVATMRGDRAGALGGAIAGLWLGLIPLAWPLAAALGPGPVALAATAALLLGHERLARGGGPASAGLIGSAAAFALLADARAVPLVATVAALVGYRARRGARWAMLAPALGLAVALVLIAAAALVGALHGPSAARAVGFDLWLTMLVDLLGPVALVVGGVGVAHALGARGERWLGAALAAALVAALPPASSLAPTALAALAVGLGHGVGLAARAVEARSPAPTGWARPVALATGLALVILLPTAWFSVSRARDRDRARVSSYAAAAWKSSPVTGR